MKMLDLRLADLITVTTMESNDLHYAFFFVDTMRRFGHKNCYVKYTQREISDVVDSNVGDFSYEL